MSTNDANMLSVEPSTTEYKRLVKKRTLLKKTIAASRKFIQSFDTKSKTCRLVKVRLEEVYKTIEKYEEIQALIEDIDDRPDVQDDERLAFQEDCNEIRAFMLDVIDEYDKVDLNRFRENTPQSSATRDGGFVKLPSVPAPTFDGTLQDWPSFIDSFNAMFHENLNIATVQKFHYLKSCLVGSASDIVKTIPTTAENYPQAYNALVSRYENKTLIIQSHIRSLFETPKVDKASAYELRLLHHHIVSHVRSLKALGQPTQHWDAWLVTLVCSRLDSVTVGEWQLRQSSNELPLYSDIENFLASRVAAFEAGEASNTQVLPIDRTNKLQRQANSVPSKFNEKRVLFTKPSDYKYKCTICNQDHQLQQCNDFLKMSVEERKGVVFKGHLCYNCLRSNHQVRDCKCSWCTKCGKKHHSLLHQDYKSQNVAHLQNTGVQESNCQAARSSSLMVGIGSKKTSFHAQSSIQVLLATVVVEVCDAKGNAVQCRAVLDSGSQLSFITSKCAHTLGLNIVNVRLPITGIGESSTKSHQCCTAVVQSRFENVKFNLQMHVLPTITSHLPTQAFNMDTLNIPNDLRAKLADPKFNQPGTVDILLGAELFFDILKHSKFVVSEQATFRDTVFGWILTGKIVSVQSNNYEIESDPVMCYSSALSLLIVTPLKDQAEEEATEKHFQSTVSRNNDGRFIVRLPLKLSPSVIGDSLAIAKKRFLNLDSKLSKNTSLHMQYDSFMDEYVTMGHMEQITSQNNDSVSYYLPHHAVMKDNSLTTKMRVVFDASATGRCGLSLNDIMMKGPTVQPTLYSILLRFRVHRFALTADIEKMYRQILVHPDDCELQKIVYRSNPLEPLKEFKLQTVTYGTKAAPYLATRCLVHLGSEANSSNARRAIREDFYVDDLLSGGESIEECLQLYHDVSTTLLSACMPLRKWCTNSKILSSQMSSLEQDPNYLLNLTENDTISTLGITWNPNTDCFQFVLKSWTPPVRMTKRSLLADINRIYDPLGFLTPVLIKGKIFLQKLWLLKLDWDSILPFELQEKWKIFYSSLTDLESLTIPRRILYARECIELHGFSDASQDAFGACVYVKTIGDDKRWISVLYTSKSRVAPTRQTTIPRLELCGAVLLVEVMSDVITELKRMNIQVAEDKISFWTDSSVVLAWIRSCQPLKSYVANRVAQILDHSNQSQWKHVPTNQNPADVISRGISAKSVKSNVLWWTGPEWLVSSKSDWPSTIPALEEIPEVRCIKLTLTVCHMSNELLERYSSWIRLIRITGWILRFKTNIKLKKDKRLKQHLYGLSVYELSQARTLWIQYAQREVFNREYNDLNAGRQVSRKSWLKTLSPFVDSNGIIRVGGRLSNSQLSYCRKHPAVLPAKHKVTKLIFIHEHEVLLHIGPQGLLASLHTRYWPLRGRNLARNVVHKCVICFKAKPTINQPFMAPLPKERVRFERAFLRSGVDFCGPVLLKTGLRKIVPVKGYISVFVCLVTRAVHLEIVSALTTEAFLAAIMRFMARRGFVSHFYSDNATNFVGADKLLKSFLKEVSVQDHVQHKLVDLGVQWHFIPPAAPNFGGIWEAAVKSAKKHMCKITKGVLYTYEELSTLLCRIEAVLNSRPLTPISNEPAEYDVLTPGHFLIGNSILLPPEPDLSNVRQNRLKQFNLLRAQYQNFWKRWSNEYLPQLQKRGKWYTNTEPVAVDQLAILKEDGRPPLQWKLVRISELHPGADGIIRVVTVRTADGSIFKRPVSKIAILPVDDEEESNIKNI